MKQNNLPKHKEFIGQMGRYNFKTKLRRGGRVVEGARLESV